MKDPQARRRVRPFPDVPTSLLLTIGALLAAGFIGFLFIDLGTLAATAIGTVLGAGGVATLAARRVAEPQAARIGLVGIDWRVVPVVFALVPAALLAKELDNVAYHWAPAEAVEAPAEADASAGAQGDSSAASGTAAESEVGHAADEARATTAADEASPSDELGKTAEEAIDSSATGAIAGSAEAGGSAGESKTDPATSDATNAASATSTGSDGSGASTERASESPGGSADASAGEAARSVPLTEPDPILEPLIDPSSPYSLMEALIFYVGIEPVIHEFLFRGVIQQGLVTQLGLFRGVTLTSLLWTMLQPVPAMSPVRFAAAFASWFALGWLLGMVRAATGSILGSILLTSLWSAVGMASIALMDRMSIPGLTIEGTHLPLEITVASAILVGVGAWRIVSLARLARGA